MGADCSPAKETSVNVLSIRFFEEPRASSRVLKLHMASWKSFFGGVCSKRSDCFSFNRARASLGKRNRSVDPGADMDLGVVRVVRWNPLN